MPKSAAIAAAAATKIGLAPRKVFPDASDTAVGCPHVDTVVQCEQVPQGEENGEAMYRTNSKI